MRGPPSYGPHTAGSKIDVAGVEIQLPPDVFINGVMVAADCPVGRACMSAPAYVLHRGEHYPTHIAIGEGGAFDALLEQLNNLGFPLYDPY